MGHPVYIFSHLMPGKPIPLLIRNKFDIKFECWGQGGREDKISANLSVKKVNVNRWWYSAFKDIASLSRKVNLCIMFIIFL